MAEEKKWDRWEAPRLPYKDTPQDAAKKQAEELAKAIYEARKKNGEAWRG